MLIRCYFQKAILTNFYVLLQQRSEGIELHEDNINVGATRNIAEVDKLLECEPTTSEVNISPLHETCFVILHLRRR